MTRRRGGRPDRSAALCALVLAAQAPWAGRTGAQLFDWAGITVKQYAAQKAYSAVQKSDMTYKDWSRENGYGECIDDEDDILGGYGNSFTCAAMVALGCERDVSNLLTNEPRIATGRAWTAASCSGGGNPASREACEGVNTNNVWTPSVQEAGGQFTQATCTDPQGIGDDGTGIVAAPNRTACTGLTGYTYSPATCVDSTCGPNDFTPECVPTECALLDSSGEPNFACAQKTCEERGITVGEVCPFTCQSCKEVPPASYRGQPCDAAGVGGTWRPPHCKGGMFEYLAIVRGTDMCSMCAQGSNSTFAWFKHPHCGLFSRPGRSCFPKWEVGCPRQCAQYFDKRVVAGTIGKAKLHAYLAEDGRWYITHADICSSLERWDGVVAPAREAVEGPSRLPHIDAKVLDVRVPLVCRATSEPMIFQGVAMQWGPPPRVESVPGTKKGNIVVHPDSHARLHWELRTQHSFPCEAAFPEECGAAYDRKVALEQAMAEATSQAMQQAALEAAQGGR